MIIFWVLLILNALVAGIRLLRQDGHSTVLLTAIGWVASLLLALSIIFLPFVNFTTREKMEANATWLIEQAELIDVVYEIPGAAEWLPATPLLSAELILESLEVPNKELLLHSIERKQSINGLDFIRIVQPIRPNLSLHIGSLLAAGVIGWAGFLLVIFSIGEPGKTMVKIASLVCGAELLILLGYIASVDTLGQTRSFPINLLLTLAEARLGVGFWVMLLSQGVVFACSLPVWFDSDKGFETFPQEDAY